MYGGVRPSKVRLGKARFISKYFMVRRDGVRLCWVRSGVAMLGKVRLGKARFINNEYRIRLGSAWRGSVGFGKARLVPTNQLFGAWLGAV